MTTIINKTSKPIRQDLLRRIARGVQLHYPSGQLVLAGQTFDMPTDLVSLLQGDIDVMDAADKAYAQWLATVEAQRGSHAKVGPVIRALKRRVLADFGDTPQASATLADFGLAPPTVPQPTAETKATAVEKRRATREARHTMGKNQKKNVKGTVTAPSPTTSGPSPAPAPAQATPVTGTAPHA